MAYQTPQSTTADLSLADLQDLFKKILSADIAHFKTTPGYEKSPEEKETILSDTAPGGEVHPSQASLDIPTTEIKSHLFRFRLPNQMLTTPACSLTWCLVISGELSLMISCIALALSAGTICHLPCTVVG